jgi:hypothetical protein
MKAGRQARVLCEEAQEVGQHTRACHEELHMRGGLQKRTEYHTVMRVTCCVTRSAELECRLHCSASAPAAYDCVHACSCHEELQVRGSLQQSTAAHGDDEC